MMGAEEWAWRLSFTKMNRSLGDFAQLQAGSPSGEREGERRFWIHTLAWPGLEVLPQELEKGGGGGGGRGLQRKTS